MGLHVNSQVRAGTACYSLEKAAVEGERRTVEADLGPMRYLATLIGADNETVLRWFILAVALLLDPAAVLLLLAATAARRGVSRATETGDRDCRGLTE